MKQLAFEPKRMMKEFRVYDTGIRKIRVGHDMDGGYVLLDHLLRRRSNGVAYSYGIGREVSWDLEMAEKFGFEVFQYDPTVEGPAVEHERFRFHQQGVAGLPANGQPKLTDPLRLKKRPAKSLTDHLRANGHANRNDLIMKMDVEGYEWEVFDSETEATLRCFGQIVVEVHCLATARMYREFALILAKMNRIFRVCHVHANNFGRVYREGSTIVPDTLEVTFVRRDLVPKARATRVRLPGSLDRPCHPGLKDIRLDFYPFSGA